MGGLNNPNFGSGVCGMNSIVDAFVFRMLPAAANVGSGWTSFCVANAAANSEVCICPRNL